MLAGAGLPCLITGRSQTTRLSLSILPGTDAEEGDPRPPVTAASMAARIFDSGRTVGVPKSLYAGMRPRLARAMARSERSPPPEVAPLLRQLGV